MVGELGVSSIVPLSGSDSSRCRPLLRRVPRVGSPTSSLVLRHSDFSRPRRCSLSSHRRSQFLAGGRQNSQVPGQPLPPCPGRKPPVEPARRGPRIDSAVRAGLAFRAQNRVGLHNVDDFGAQSHGPAAHCLRFTSTLAGVRARLASGWRPLPCPVGTLTRRLLPRVLGRYALLSGQSWPGAP